ncbi:GNAT family N-acetyltransferase [Nocardia sp. NPDC004722]
MRYWPVAGLRVRTPRLELRVPDLDQLGALAALAAAGVHDPGVQPFTAEWTDTEPDERARRVLRFHWKDWAVWEAGDWSLNLVVLRDGEVVGTQSVGATNFGVCAEVNTGSWLGLDHHGQGIGTEMRAAVLDLAFAHLGAQSATSGAFEDNPGSSGISRKLGYEPDGIALHAIRGEAAVIRRLRLSRERWEAHRTVPVEVTGLAECRSLFG